MVECCGAEFCVLVSGICVRESKGLSIVGMEFYESRLDDCSRPSVILLIPCQFRTSSKYINFCSHPHLRGSPNSTARLVVSTPFVSCWCSNPSPSHQLSGSWPSSWLLHRKAPSQCPSARTSINDTASPELACHVVLRSPFLQRQNLSSIAVDAEQ